MLDANIETGMKTQPHILDIFILKLGEQVLLLAQMRIIHKRYRILYSTQSITMTNNLMGFLKLEWIKCTGMGWGVGWGVINSVSHGTILYVLSHISLYST